MKEVKYLPTSLTEAKKIQKVFAQYTKELGFVSYPQILELAKKKEVIYIEENNEPISACIFHERRDGFTTIYDIATIKQHLGKGYARDLINHLLKKGHILRFKCPEELESNNFYKKIGAKLINKEKGKKRALNVYLLS